MTLLHVFRNRRQVPGFLVNSLPKSGTHLLTKTMGLFPGIRASRNTTLSRSYLKHLDRHDGDVTDRILVGVDWPAPVNARVISRLLDELRPATFLPGHLPYSALLLNLLSERHLKALLIIRDPRDVVVSHAHYVSHSEDHFLFDHYGKLTKAQRVAASITGLNAPDSELPNLLDINLRYRSVLEWETTPLNLTVCFERLVGPMGGGSRKEQHSELRTIANHLGIQCTNRRIYDIGNMVFGGTSTFRKGIIGDWVNHFTDEHKTIFKEIAGDLLIDLGYEQTMDW